MLSLRATSLAAAMLLSASACREPEAGLHVQVDGPLAPGVDFDRLTLVAYLATDDTPLFAEALDGPTLPVTFNLVSGRGTPAGTKVEVLASAELLGEVVSATRGTATLQPAEGSTLVLTLAAPPLRPDGRMVEACDDGVDNDGDALADCADVTDCAGQSCAAGGLRCVMGACQCQMRAVGVWGSSASDFTPRLDAQAVAFTRGPASGVVVIAGGRTEAGAPTAQVELYRPGFSLDPVVLQAPRNESTLVLNPAGELLFVGGTPVPGNAPGALPVEHLEPSTASTTATSFEMPTVLSGANAVVWGQGWLLFGGTLGAELLELVPPGDGGAFYSTRSIATLAFPRTHGVVLQDGRVFFASGPVETDLTEILSPDGGVAVGPRVPIEVRNAALVPLPDGRALLAGGEVAGSPRGDAFIVAAQGDAVTLQPIAPMSAAHQSPRAYALGNGWVYFEPASGVAEWFDFASERFVLATPAPSMTTGATIAPLRTRIFRVGGQTSAGTLSPEGAFLDLQCAP